MACWLGPLCSLMNGVDSFGGCFRRDEWRASPVAQREGCSHWQSDANTQPRRELTVYFLRKELQYWSLELRRKGLPNIHKGIALRNQGPSYFSWYFFYVSIDDIFLGLYHHCPRLIPCERNRPLRGPIRIWFFWPKTS